ncbi:MAG TPA: PDZ domain-containing protein [Terracidiphilus sp.]
MKYLLRPYRSAFRLGATLCLSVLAGFPAWAGAQSARITQAIEDPSPYLRSNSQGYLGVLVGDINQENATKLKLKETHGAVVTLIDHDAPAAQAGVRVNDVLLQVNGQAVESAEQFGRLLRELPAGRKVTLLVSRDGAQQAISLQLVDRKAMEQDVWNKLGQNEPGSGSAPAMGILSGSGADAPLPGGFHMPFFGSSLNVGAMVEPLTSQMAEYLGVPSGLMVKQVARKSEAAASGMKAFDVVLKVGADPVVTMADWDRMLRANAGKAVQVTILRDRKQQTLTLQVDSKHRRSELEQPVARTSGQFV